ncbi:interferon-inducible GTPase-domain-containing protein [Achaetomium macrosporum]|uniref:Interferon-inducible GTPase-domain-containing protein n=1 Tax=Achaetomium macrosporum TaxID=79813 RepID=A0AAN7C0Z6_9PEZI|nr:interferon-inducible GTPase-domain-containing protein [Achaetomium macrosporum]
MNNWGRVRYEPGKGVSAEGPIGAVIGATLLLLGAASQGAGAETLLRQAAEREAAQAKKEAKEHQRQAEDATKRADEAQQAEALEKEARAAAERRATEAVVAEQEERRRREEADAKVRHERRLREMGVEPDREITDEEIRNARLAVGYKAGRTNIAVIGRQNEGKSTLVNCLRGLRHRAPGSAAVGEAETTQIPTAYLDEMHPKFVWHDIPGGGTPNIPAWGYYYNNRLFAYDKVLLVHNSTISELDIRVMQLCAYLRQECIVVRTKADVHIRNCKRNRNHPTVEAAREDYVCQVRRDTEATNARSREVMTMHVEVDDFIVCEQGVTQIVNGAPPSDDPFEQVIDEARLIERLGL